MRKVRFSTYQLVFIALMAAMVFVCTLIRVPFLDSKVHAANAVCVLCGFLLSPVHAGLAAGLGSMLYDFTLGGYDALGCAITFASKFLMAFVCAVLTRRLIRHGDGFKSVGAAGRSLLLLYIIAAVSALTYVALYMLKTFALKQLVDGLEINAVFVVMLEKLPASLINAAFAALVAPPLFLALFPALQKAGILAKLK